MSPHILRRLFWGLVPVIGMAVASALIRPLWLDEYWSLYFSDVVRPFFEVWTTRIRVENHPPLFYLSLMWLRHVINAPFGFKLLSILVVYGYGLRAVLKARDDETKLYWLLILGSYWAIYYTVELRAYGIVFFVATLATILTRDWLSRHAPKSAGWKWITLGTVMALTNYFGSLWYGIVGAGLSLVLWRQGRRDQAMWVMAGVAAMIVLSLIWIGWSSRSLSFHAHAHQRGLTALGIFWGQSSRAVLKTLACNLAITGLALLAVRQAKGRPDLIETVLWASVGATLSIALLIHVFVYAMVAERTLIMLMPPMLLCLTRLALRAEPDSILARRVWFMVPVMMVITPVLFVSEFFKDQPEIRHTGALVGGFGDCRGAPVLTAVAQDFHPDFATMLGGYTVSGGGEPPEFMQGVWGASKSPPQAPVLIEAHAPLKAVTFAPACRLRAALLNEPRGRTAPEFLADLAVLKAALKAQGIEIDQLQELTSGGGRHHFYVVRKLDAR